MDGILNINKPPGKTSFGVVAAIKRITGERRAGHAGTLDPNATGVLPVCLGKATRIVEFLQDAHKVYRATIELGTTTDTYDAAGKIVKKQGISCVYKDMVEIALSSFRGTIRQTPPMFSALKHKGRPLYDIARAGESVELKARPVTIYRLDLLEWKPPLVIIEVECSKGTYIRSIANDLGEMLGSGAYLKELVRSAYGIFKIEDAITPEQLEEAVKAGNREQYLHPIDSVLGHLPSLTVDETGEKDIKTGNPPKVFEDDTPPPETTYCRAYSKEGKFLAILVRDKEYSLWRPKKVFI